MQPILTLTFAASMAALTAAVPLGHSHHLFRPRAPLADIIAAPQLVQRDSSVSVDLLTGICGGSSGFGCAPGFCCSQYGYCGQGPEYCGGGGQQQGSPAPASPATSIAVTTPSSNENQNLPFVPSVGASTAPALSAPTLPSAAATYAPSITVVPTQVSTAAASTQATSAAVSSAAPAPVPSSGTGSGGAGMGDSYTMYSGNGDANAGWPATSSWISFDSMWSNNVGDIMQSCSQFGVPNNSEAETNDLKSAIQSVGASSGVDPRFILAVVLQESAGCVRAPTTNYGVTNPGLMQDHDGTGSCNNGQVLNPCPMSQITQMIQDGTEGTSSGDGLKQCLAEAPTTSGAAQYYQAARIYNSGSIAAGGNLDAGIATLCYSSDIANRLTGWVNAPTQCNL